MSADPGDLQSPVENVSVALSGDEIAPTPSLGTSRSGALPSRFKAGPVLPQKSSPAPDAASTPATVAHSPTHVVTEDPDIHTERVPSTEGMVVPAQVESAERDDGVKHHGGVAPAFDGSALDQKQSSALVGASDELAQSGSEKKSWMARLKQGLSRTGRNIGGLFVGSKIEESLYEDLESALIMADAGVQASTQLIQQLRKRVNRDRLQSPEQVRKALADVLSEHLRCLEKPFDVGHVKPQVVMIAGVNGAGKTTSIGKLAYTLQKHQLKVLLAAGDTFRAAAREQLVEWGHRNNIAVIAQQGGDPAAVAFDAVHAGHARDMDVVMVDTAGRLPTQLHLMEELKKIHRVIRKADADAPHEVLLVVDGNTGQNALAQIKAFDDALTLTGLIVTKLDGTAKGGVLAALAAGAQGCRPVPVYWVGVGEQLEDLQPFVAREFAQALIGDAAAG